MGRFGWGDESHVRVLEAGVKVASGAMVGFEVMLRVNRGLSKLGQLR